MELGSGGSGGASSGGSGLTNTLWKFIADLILPNKTIKGFRLDYPEDISLKGLSPKQISMVGSIVAADPNLSRSGARVLAKRMATAQGEAAVSPQNVPSGVTSQAGTYDGGKGYTAKGSSDSLKFFDLGGLWDKLTPKERKEANMVFVDVVGAKGEGVRWNGDPLSFSPINHSDSYNEIARWEGHWGYSLWVEQGTYFSSPGQLGPNWQFVR